MTAQVRDRSRSRAQRLLKAIGWRPLANKQGHILLEDVLVERLREINAFEFQGEQYRFSEEAIDSAVKTLATSRGSSTAQENERVWRLLRFGVSVEQTIDGHLRSYAAQYIDWAEPSNNVYHLIGDFEATAGRYTPDIVLFVNGIPLVVIDCKAAAIDELLQAQSERPAPAMFRYAQLLLALQSTESAYATVGSSRTYWQHWKEQEDDTKAIQHLLYTERTVAPPAQESDQWEAVLEQDRLLYALCRPARLLQLTHIFTFFDAGVRRMARAHQFFAAQAILEQVSRRTEGGRRHGGLVWQAPGTGKSMTMLMAAVAILANIKESNTRIVLISDRAAIDSQLYSALRGSGIECRQATTGRDLLELLGSSQIRVITTTIQKFDAAVRSETVQIDNPNIFVLIDEAERSQFGAFGASMRRVLPRACFLAFTSTPTLRSVECFGPLIARPYSIQEAVRDRSLLPLYYERRQIGDEYTAVIKQARQIADLYGDGSEFPGIILPRIFEFETYIRATASDISSHFTTHFADGPYKGLLIAGSQSAALSYKHNLDQIGLVTSEVLVTFPAASRRGVADPLEQFHSDILRKFGSTQRYDNDVIERFVHAKHPHILICVDRFIGLDAPPCAVVYLTRPLSRAGLLQAISRTTRPWGNKERALIVDYWDQQATLAAALNPDLPTHDASQESNRSGTFTALCRPVDELSAADQLDSLSAESPLSPEIRAKSGFKDVLSDVLQTAGTELTISVDTLAGRIYDAVLKQRKVDWTVRPEARRRMLKAMDDELFEVRDVNDRRLDVAVVDQILHRCLEVATHELP